MPRLRGFADLQGLKVGVFGLGVEGRASVARLATLGIRPVVVDDARLDDELVSMTSEGGLEALFHCDVVLKSPGISRYRADVIALHDAGVVVTSALALWLAETDRRRVIAVTGTKGKSTTTSLITFFLNAVGLPARSAGNIGTPPYDPSSDDSFGWTVLEVSSFQAVDILDAPAIVVLTSLDADHLDWHGSLEAYQRDKLSLTFAAGPHHTVVSSTLPLTGPEMGGELLVSSPDDAGLADQLQLIGRHNRANVALALEVVTLVTGDRDATITAVRAVGSSFTPLPGRLTVLGRVASCLFIDDGLATNPLATLAALESCEDEELDLLMGGFDRGMDYEPLISALRQRTRPLRVHLFGALAARVAPELIGISHDVSDTLDAAFALAVTAGATVLFSPAAPSFDQYRNWEERSAHFRRLVSALS